MVTGPDIASCMSVIDSEYRARRPSVLGVSAMKTAFSWRHEPIRESVNNSQKGTANTSRGIPELGGRGRGGGRGVEEAPRKCANLFKRYKAPRNAPRIIYLFEKAAAKNRE